MLFIRYGIGTILVVAGIVLLVVNPGGFGVDGFAMADGAGLSVLLLNFLFRLGVRGDMERTEEERARRYLAEHGHWPDQAPAVSGETTPPNRNNRAVSPADPPHRQRRHEPLNRTRTPSPRPRRRGD